jgi:galactose mutarotase-like enzyme
MESVIENDFLKVKIKSKGAELISVVNKDTGLEYMWGADPAFWGKTSPILFPIVGTLKEDTFLFDEQKYSLPRHGFARDEEFAVEEKQNDQVTFLLTSTEASLKKYPFAFELRVQYHLEDNFLFVTYEVNNTGEDAMYFSIGGHPAFKVPLANGTRYEDYYLEFNKTENAGRWPITKEGLIAEKPTALLSNTNKLPLTRELFQQDAIVLKNLKSDRVSLKSDKSAQGLEFYFKGFPYLGIWAQKGADFVCIEPWCGIADSTAHNQELIEKEGIEEIEPGDSWTEGWKVKFY